MKTHFELVRNCMAMWADKDGVLEIQSATDPRVLALCQAMNWKPKTFTNHVAILIREGVVELLRRGNSKKPSRYRVLPVEAVINVTSDFGALDMAKKLRKEAEETVVESERKAEEARLVAKRATYFLTMARENVDAAINKMGPFARFVVGDGVQRHLSEARDWLNQDPDEKYRPRVKPLFKDHAA